MSTATVVCEHCNRRDLPEHRTMWDLCREKGIFPGSVIVDNDGRLYYVVSIEANWALICAPHILVSDRFSELDDIVVASLIEHRDPKLVRHVRLIITSVFDLYKNPNYEISDDCFRIRTPGLGMPKSVCFLALKNDEDLMPAWRVGYPLQKEHIGNFTTTSITDYVRDFLFVREAYNEYCQDEHSKRLNGLTSFYPENHR